MLKHLRFVIQIGCHSTKLRLIHLLKLIDLKLNELRHLHLLETDTKFI